MAPPSPGVVLATKVELRMEPGLVQYSPPPALAELLLLLNTQLWIVSGERLAPAYTPPPLPVARPLAIVKPESVTAPPVMLNTRSRLPPLTVSTLAPGPRSV